MSPYHGTIQGGVIAATESFRRMWGEMCHRGIRPTLGLSDPIVIRGSGMLIVYVFSV